MGIFENFILNEAAPPQPQQPQQQQNQGPAQLVQPPAEPPDMTQGDPGQAPPAAGANDPNAAPADTAQGEDPNAAAQDPNAQGGDPNDPTMQQDPNQLQGPPSPNNEIEQAEQQTFSDLKPEQMDIKIRELKGQYKILHDNILKSLEKINKVSHTTYDDQMLDFIVRKLISLKNITRDSLNDTFATRTYAENKFEFQRLVLIFNLIANMISEIYRARIERKKAIDEITAKQSKNTSFPTSGFPQLFRRNGPEE